jgi:phasin
MPEAVRDKGTKAMAEASASIKTKPTKPTGTPSIESRFEARSDAMKFDLPKMEIPTAFREIAEKGVSQAKENYEKLKAVAEEATDVLEETYSTASRGAADYGLKLIEVARANTNATFDFAGELMNAKTFSEVVELSTAHARKQFEALTTQSKELTAIAQKVAMETAEPVKNGVSKAFNRVAV